MSLFAFDPTAAAASPVGGLLDPSQRQKTASEVNAAILAGTSQARSAWGWIKHNGQGLIGGAAPKLLSVLQMMRVSEEKLAGNGAFPTIDLMGALHLPDAGHA